ncbi:MAG: hypothetical protein V4477_02385 [Pseudomonadota bacterium]
MPPSLQAVTRIDIRDLRSAKPHRVAGAKLLLPGAVSVAAAGQHAECKNKGNGSVGDRFVSLLV